MATTSTPPPVKAEPDNHQPPHFINSVTELRCLSTALSAFQRRYDDLQGHLDYIRTTIDSKLPKHLNTTPPPQTQTPTPTPSETAEKPKLPNRLNTTPPPQNQLAVKTLIESPSSNAEKPKLPNDLNTTTPPQNKLAVKTLTEIPSSKAKRPKLPNHLNTTTPPQNQLAVETPTETPSSNAEKPKLPHRLNTPQNQLAVEIPTETLSSNAEKPKLLNHLNNTTAPSNQLAVKTLTETPSSSDAKAPVSESANSEVLPNTEKQSQLEQLCKMMCGRGLRRYLVSHMSDVDKLREEAPKALKCAPNPAKMVLECLGRFFLQGTRAYTKKSDMIVAREASILALEIFMLMGCDAVEIEPAVKEEAEEAAVLWRKRLKNEGPLANACEIDARGLLLLVGCYGIPSAFSSEDIGHLIWASNVRKIFGVLRRSSILLARIPEVIEGMAKNKMEIEAVDIAYTFEIERFPQQILTSFLRESEKTWKKRQGALASSAEVNEANKKQLANLNSVIKCLKGHKIDPSKLLPEWKIDEKILSLKKEIADHKKIDEKVTAKRKKDQTSSNKLKTQKVDTSQFADHVTHQQNAAYTDVRSSNDGLTQKNYLDGGFPGYINTSAGSLPNNIAGSVAGSARGFGGVLPTGSYSGAHGGMLVDTVGQIANHYNEMMVGQSRTFSGQPSYVGFNGMYRPSPSLEGFGGPSPSLEGFSGLPNHPSVGLPGRSSASDLYDFADAVERESHRSSGSRTGGTVPSAHHSSYLY